jgi:hypothetical protein
VSLWQSVEVVYQVGTVLMALVCFAAFIVNHRTLDLLAASSVVFTFTMISAFIVDNYPAPWHSAHMIPQDVACAWVAWWAAGRTTERWPQWVKVVFATQCGIHALYWGSLCLSRWFFHGQADGFLKAAYPWPINALFVITIVVLTSAGGGHVARYVRDCLRRFLHSPSAFGTGGAR